MSITYSLANYKTKEMIFLGKGPWYILRDEPEIMLYRSGIKALLRSEGWYDAPNDINYVNGVVDLIWNFVHDADPDDLIIASEGEESYILKAYGYIYVGSRYPAQDVSALNEHLSPARAHMYRRQDAERCIESTNLDIKKL